MALFVQHDVIYCDWEESGKLVPYKGNVVAVKNKSIKVEFGDGEKWWFSLKQQAGLRRTRGLKRTSELAFGASERTSKRKPVSERSTSSYNATSKAGSKNKAMCREIMVAGLPTTNASKRALVLDAEDMQFTHKLIEEKGFRSDKIDVPNCNGPEVIAQMEELGIGNVHGGVYMGDFMRSVEKAKKRYDLVYADYCGQPGKIDKINTPLHDVNELFALKLVAPSATIGVTVCIRNNASTKIMYQNMHRVTNAVVSAAFTHGFVATIKCQTTYKDSGSQTMCFACVRVEQL